MRPVFALSLFLALAACAGAPVHTPLPAAHNAGGEKSLVSGTIGAWVEAAEGGVRVKALDPDGPAMRAGLRPGDLIVRYNGAALPGVREFNRRVAQSPPRSIARLATLRGTQAFTADVEVTQLRTAVRL